MVRKKSKFRSGFTLIELLAVVVIVTLVIGIAIPNILKIINNSKDKSEVLALNNIKSSANYYIKENNKDVIWTKDNNNNNNNNNYTCINVNSLINKGYLKEKDISNLDKFINYKYIILTKNSSDTIISEKIDEEGICYNRPNVIEIPSCNDNTYDGTSKILIDENNSKYTISNNTGTNAGIYKVTLKLKQGYYWMDSTNEDKNISCTINKATPSIKLDPYGTDNGTAGKNTITKLTSNIDGTIELRSSNTSYVSANVDDNNVSANKEKNININFLSSRKTDSYITVNFISKDTNYNNTSVIYSIGNINSKYKVTYNENLFSTKYGNTYNGVYINFDNNNIITLNGVYAGNDITLWDKLSGSNDKYNITIKYISGSITNDAYLNINNNKFKLPKSGSINKDINNTSSKIVFKLSKDGSNVNFSNYKVQILFTKNISNNIVYGDKYSNLSTPNKYGYKFLGWYTNITGGVKVTSNTQMNVNENHTLYARYTPYKAIINYNSNGGVLNSSTYSLNSNNYVISNNKLVTSTIYYNQYSRLVGFDFTKNDYGIKTGKEWIDDSGKTYNQSSLYTVNDFCNSNEDCTKVLKANWLSKAVITCNNKNYNGSYQTIASCSGGTVNNAYKRDAGNYTVLCTGDSNHVNAASKICSIKKVSATITCNNKDYNGSYQTIASCSGGTVNNAYKRDVGNYKVSCTGDSNHVDATNKTCSINKVEEKVTISFDSNGGSGSMSSQSCNKGKSCTLKSNSFTRNGYTFDGWGVSSSGSKFYNDKASYTFGSNVTLYAVWKSTEILLTCPSSPSNKNYNDKSQNSGITCPTGSTAGGTQSAIKAGTYYQTCTANTGYKFSSSCSVSWTINKVAATITCSDKNYNGSNQTGCSCSGGTIGGTYTARNAETYTASCTGDSNHTNPSNKSWTINKVAATLTCSNKDYTGSKQTGCTCSGGNIGGTYTAKNAGTYTASCTGDSNHTNPSNKTWTINKVCSEKYPDKCPQYYLCDNADEEYTEIVGYTNIRTSAKYKSDCSNCDNGNRGDSLPFKTKMYVLGTDGNYKIVYVNGEKRYVYAKCLKSVDKLDKPKKNLCMGWDDKKKKNTYCSGRCDDVCRG